MNVTVYTCALLSALPFPTLSNRKNMLSFCAQVSKVQRFEFSEAKCLSNFVARVNHGISHRHAKLQHAIRNFIRADVTATDCNLSAVRSDICLSIRDRGGNGSALRRNSITDGCSCSQWDLLPFTRAQRIFAATCANARLPVVSA